MNIYPKTTKPLDPYDTLAWEAFYAANPGFRRSVGAEGVNDDEDTGGDDAEKVAADKAAAEKAAADKAAADKAAENDDSNDGKPSDAEAALLKDAMKHKEARRAAEAKLKELEDKLSGVDLDEYKELRTQREEAAAAKKKAEEDAAIAAGDFDKVREQMTTQYESQIEKIRTDLTTELETTKAELDKSKSIIEELTVGSQFNTSKLISEETVYTASKARRLYGDHFEVEDGKVVAYDKPRGTEDRTRLVDAKGNSADFETAMRRIIEADPEKDEILVSPMKPGASSKPGTDKVQKTDTHATAREKIASGLGDLMKSIDKPTDGGVKLS